MFISTLALIAGPAAFLGMASAAPLDVRTSYIPDNCCDTDYSLIHPYNNNSLCLTAPYDAHNGLHLTVEKCRNSAFGQKWVIDDGEIMLYDPCLDNKCDKGFCLDASDRPKPGLPAIIWTCADLFSQKWYLGKDHKISLSGNYDLCLTRDFDKAKVDKCYNLATQEWKVECKKDECKPKCPKKEEPCDKPKEPCPKKEEPCDKPKEPCPKKEEPCPKKEEPYPKKEEPCPKKEEPCDKPKEPCYKPKEPCDKPKDNGNDKCYDHKCEHKDKCDHPCHKQKEEESP